MKKFAFLLLLTMTSPAWSQYGAEDAFTNFQGADWNFGWSPGYVPDQPNGGRYGNGYTMAYGQCVFPHPPAPTRFAGMAVVTWNPCPFPFTNSMSMTVDQAWPSRWAIYGEARHAHALTGTTYQWYAESWCRGPNLPGYPNYADMVVFYEWAKTDLVTGHFSCY